MCAIKSMKKTPESLSDKSAGSAAPVNPLLKERKSRGQLERVSELQGFSSPSVCRLTELVVLSWPHLYKYQQRLSLYTKKEPHYADVQPFY